jgi:hypothetical protein
MSTRTIVARMMRDCARLREAVGLCVCVWDLLGSFQKMLNGAVYLLKYHNK